MQRVATTRADLNEVKEGKFEKGAALIRRRRDELEAILHDWLGNSARDALIQVKRPLRAFASLI